jgi:YihY family inner membrane protein
MHGRVVAASAWGHERFERLERSRSSNATIDTAFQFVDRDTRTIGSALAGALAFRLFLFVLPLVLVLVGLFDIFGKDLADASKSMGMHDAAASVEDATKQTGNEWWWLLPVGLYFLYFATSALLKMLQLIHRVVWDQLEGRVRVSPRQVGWMFVAIVAVVLVAGFAGLVRERSEGLGIAAALLVMVVYFASWLIVSRLLPHRDVPWTALIPGAALFAVGVQVVYMLTIFWIAGKIESASALYGALGVAAAILLWLYLLGRVVVASAVLNVTVWERKHGAPPPEASGNDAASPSA